MADETLYRSSSVRALFNEMARTYGIVNLVSSFGFARRWRRQVVAGLPGAAPVDRVADLMSGMGELWRPVFRRFGPSARVVAVDISEEMTGRARRDPRVPVTVHVEDVLAFDPEPASFDAVVSSFGLKTFSPAQQEQLAARVARSLRPGGVFSFVEISVPPGRGLRLFYMLYVKRVIPLLGRLLLGNPSNYRLLGVYTEAFGDCRHFTRCLQRVGLEASFVLYFFGCATGVLGRKPA